MTPLRGLRLVLPRVCFLNALGGAFSFGIRASGDITLRGIAKDRLEAMLAMGRINK
jgi:hypothetical protein